MDDAASIESRSFRYHKLSSACLSLFLWVLLVSCTTTPRKPEVMNDLESVTVDHSYFKILYSKRHRLPVWVEYTATKENLKGPGKRRNNFHKDKLLEEMGIVPVGPNDYPGSKYDRGHMAPAADFKKSQSATDATFVMTNMAPQTPSLNRRAWQSLESRVRTWICGEESIRVVTGPILTNELPRLENGISVPQRFFKVVYDETPPLKAIAFIYNQNDAGDPFLDRIVSVSEVEKEARISLPKTDKDYPDQRNSDSWKACK